MEEDPKSDVAPSASLGGSGSAAPFTRHSAFSGSLGPPSAPYPPSAPSTIAPDDSASQVAGRLYAAELARQQHASGPTAHAHASGSSSGREGRSDRKGPTVPPAVPEDPEPEAVQHQDSGLRFRDGAVLPSASLLESGSDERPPDYDAAP